jgi:hypothetical protein
MACLEEASHPGQHHALAFSAGIARAQYGADTAGWLNDLHAGVTVKMPAEYVPTADQRALVEYAAALRNINDLHAGVTVTLKSLLIQLIFTGSS